VAPGENDEMTKEILRLLELYTGIKLIDFVDDLFGSHQLKDQAWINLEKVIRFFTASGVFVSTKQKGLQPPDQQAKWVGWIFDTVGQVITVENSKMTRSRDRLEQILDTNEKNTLTASILASGTGLASHICEVYIPGRRRLHFIWRDLDSAGVYQMWQHGAKAQANHTLVSLSTEAIRDLRWLLKRFEQPPVRRLHSQGPNWPLTEWGPKSIALTNWQQLAKYGQILVVETDASKLHGWSYYTPKWQKVVNGTWPTGFASSEHNAEFRVH
jgi:hypothetical protein